MVQPVRFGLTRPEVSVQDTVQDIQMMGLRGRQLGIAEAEEARRQALFELQQQEQARQARLQQQLGTALQSENPADIVNFVNQNPQLAQQAQQAIGFATEKTRQDALGTSIKADRLLGLGDTEAAINALSERATRVKREGGNPSDTLAMIKKIQENPEEARQDLKMFLAVHPEGQEYLTALGRGETPAGGTVQQAQYIPGLGFAQLLRGGDVQLKEFTGAEKALIEKAQQVDDQRQADRAGGRRRAALEAEDELKAKVESGVVNAKEAAKASVKAFERLEPINANIRTMRAAIGELRAGAKTGAIEGRLPSIRSASVKLDNLQQRLGLDIIQNTTFGALSEGELKLALDTALPKGLNEQQLIQWLEQKASAQEKLADYVESAAIYLGTPGNTIAGWLQERAARQQAPAQQPGQPTIDDLINQYGN
jgi:hypothetical protein